MNLKLLKIGILLSLVAAPLHQVAAQTTDDEAHVNPDPHFRTWDGTYFDFHGQCDLIFVVNSVIKIYIRTQLATGYSFVQRAAIKPVSSTDVLEIDADVGAGTHSFVLNGGTPQPTPPTSVGSFPLQNPSANVYELTLNNGAWVRINTYHSISMVVHGTSPDFDDSVGMGGTWGTAPGQVDRSGDAATGDEMGAAWRVGAVASDEDLFTSDSGDDVCEPSGQGRGCVITGDVGVNNDIGCNTALCPECFVEGQAEQICAEAGVPEGALRANCAFDLETTGDRILWPIAPFYRATPPPPPDDPRCTDLLALCQLFQGQCVAGCKGSNDSLCLPFCIDSDFPEGEASAAPCSCKIPWNLEA